MFVPVPSPASSCTPNVSRAARIAAQKKSQREAQDKRQKNIDARKQSKKDKKMGIKKPKASRPGFEGKKRQFLNKK